MGSFLILRHNVNCDIEGQIALAILRKSDAEIDRLNATNPLIKVDAISAPNFIRIQLFHLRLKKNH